MFADLYDGDTSTRVPDNWKCSICGGICWLEGTGGLVDCFFLRSCHDRHAKRRQVAEGVDFIWGSAGPETWIRGFLQPKFTIRMSDFGWPGLRLGWRLTWKGHSTGWRRIMLTEMLRTDSIIKAVPGSLTLSGSNSWSKASVAATVGTTTFDVSWI